ncbi:hypothetical protein [Motilimonas cestriensis]|uniref:hypothetical protein n=1 Tax=Motilimonas cestriensis TaxID=2742685 RepID=UPI003DA4BD6B
MNTQPTKLTCAILTGMLTALSASSSAETCSQTQLQRFLTQQNQAYHAGNPCISDSSFDQLNQLLAHPISTLNTDIDNSWVSHRYPMKSLNSTTSKQMLLEFIKPLLQRANSLIIQPKIDGIAIELIYHHGQLAQASTRGNGAAGKDISALILLAPHIPKRLNQKAQQEEVVIYGELFIPQQAFKQIQDYSSSRQLTAALAQQKQPDMTLANLLNFFPYQLAQPLQPNDLASQQLLAQWGFKLTQIFSQTINDIADAERWLNTWQQDVELDADIDGVVIKAAEQNLRDSLGSNQSFPHWAMAFKPKAKRAEVTVTKLSYQVGRTGKITPILHFPPVSLGNKTVQKVSGHSVNYIKQHEINQGSSITVALAGKATPTITKVISTSTEQGYQLPFVKPGLCLSSGYACKQRFKLQIKYTMKKLGLPLNVRKEVNQLVKQGVITQLGQLGPFYQATYHRNLTKQRLLASLTARPLTLSHLSAMEHELERQRLLLARLSI